MLTRVLYLSEIVDLVTDIDILGKSQVNDPRRGVTCVLAQSDGHFAQLVEDRLDVMEPLRERMRSNVCHPALGRLLQHSIETREIARWCMGLVPRHDLSEELRLLHRDGCESPTRARTLIQRLMANGA